MRDHFFLEFHWLYLDFSGSLGEGRGQAPLSPDILEIIPYFRPAANFFSHW